MDKDKNATPSQHENKSLEDGLTPNGKHCFQQGVGVCGMVEMLTTQAKPFISRETKQCFSFLLNPP